MATKVRTSIFDNVNRTFGDIQVNQYFTSNEQLYCKISEVWDDDNQESRYNAFSVDDGCLMWFHKDETIIEIKEITVAAHL